MEGQSLEAQLAATFAAMTTGNNINTNQEGGVDPALLGAAQPPVTPDPNTAQTAAPVVPTANAPVVTPVATTPADVDSVVDSWDTVASTTPVTPQATTPVTPATAPAFDFSELAKVLENSEIKSTEDALSQVKALKSQVETIKTLPENLARAIEIASLGGNYLEYLGVNVIDWSKEDPTTLYENYVIDQYTDKDGKVDYERVDKMLDKMDDDDKELRGRELQRGYINYQVSQKSAIENQARAQRAQFETSVRNSVNSINEIAGFKLSPTHKDEIVNTILKGEDVKEQSLDKRVFNAFITKNWTKLDSFRKTQIKNAAKKDILDEVQNASITPVGEPVVSSTPKKYGIEDYIAELSQQRKF